MKISSSDRCIRIHLLNAVIAAMSVLAPFAASAANGTWTNLLTGGLWSAPANWSGGAIADASGFTADFNSINITTDPTVVHLDSARTIGNLTFGDTTTSSAAGWILDNNNTAANILTLAGGAPTIAINALGAGANVIVGPVMAGSTRWVKAGTGSLILTNANSFIAGFNLSAGTLTATNAGALGAFGVTATNTIGGTLNLNAGPVTYNGLTNNTLNGSGIINVALGTGSGSTIITTITNANFSGFNGTINIGTNGLTGEVAAAAAGKAAIFSPLGSGTTVNILPNAALYVSGIVTNRGAVTLYGGDTGEANGQLRLDSGATWAGPITLAGPVTGTGDGNVGSVSGGGNTTGPIGQIGGAQNLVKVGASTLTLSGTNTYTGYTTNLAGTLKLGNARALGDGVNNTAGLIIAGSGILDFAAITPLVNVPLTMDSTANGFDVGAIENNTASTTNIIGGTVTLLRQTRFGGVGVMLFTNTINGNTNNVIKDSTGTLQFRNNGAVALGTLTGNRGTLQVEAGTFVTVTNMNIGSGTSVGAGLTLAGGSVTNLGNTRFGTGGGTASGSLTLNSGSLTVTNLAKGGVTFNINFNGATLIAAASQTAFLPTATSAKVQAGNAIIDDGGNAITIGTSLVADGASPGGGLIKRGVGTLTLTGANTFTGASVVTNGTLALSGTGSIANSGNISLAAGTTLDVTGLSSTFAIAANQVLSGYGTVIGNATDVANAQISPGGSGSIGTLNFANDLTLVGNDTLSFDFSNGGSNDLILVAGTVNPSGVTTINLANWPLTNGFPIGTYVLLQATNSLAGSAGNFVLSHQPGRQSMSLVYDTSASPNQLLLVVSTLPGTAATLAWQGGQNVNAWDVQTTANWLKGMSSDTFYQSDSVLFSNVPATNASVNLAQTVSPASIVVNSTNDYVFASGSGGFITGPTALIKNGSGSLTFTETNNYSGGTLVSAGKLQLGDGVVNNGQISGDITNNATLAVANPWDLDLVNGISGSGQLVKSGAGTLNISGGNSFAGGTLINTGAVRVASVSALGAPASVAANIGTGASLIYDIATVHTPAGTFTGGGALVKTNVNAVTLTGSNSFSGGLIINLGAVYVGNNNALGTGPVVIDNLAIGGGAYSQLFLKNGVNISNSITVVAGASFFQGLIETDAGAYGYGGTSGSGGGTDTNGATVSGPVTLSPGTIQRGGLFTGPIGGTNWLNINGAVTNIGGSVSARNGRVRFSGGGDYAILSVAEGRTSIGANNGACPAAALTVGTASPTAFDLNGFNQEFTGLSGTGPNATLTNSAMTQSTLTLNLTSTTTFAGAVGGNLSLTLNGSGTQVLSGTNNYTGNTTVNGGTLQIALPTLATNSTVSVASGAFLQLDSAVTNQVGSLVLGGINQAPGLYDSTTAAPFITGSGSLLVVSTIANYPTNITASVSGSTLTLTWPGTHLGWYAQSNSVNLADANFWFNIPGSQNGTSLVINMNPAQTNVFYRLQKP